MGQIWSQNFKMLCLKWNSVQMGYSRVLIPNLTIVFVDSFLKCFFLGIFGQGTSENPLSWVKVSKERYYLILRTFYVTFVTLYSYSSYLSFVLVTSSINLAFALIQLSKVNKLSIFLSPFFVHVWKMVGVNVSVA